MLNINIKGIPPYVANTVFIFGVLLIILALVKAFSSGGDNVSSELLEYCSAINELQVATRAEYEKLYSDYSIKGVIKTPGQIYYEIATGVPINNHVTTPTEFSKTKSRIKNKIPKFSVYFNNRETELVFKVTPSGLVYNIPGFPNVVDKQTYYYYTATSTINPEG